MTAGGLAADQRALGYFQEALSSDRDTYESFREQFGADTERALAAAHNLASSLRLVGDYFAARHLDQETLDRQRRALPPNHPNTLLSAASLALDMRAAGAFRESVDLLRVTCAATAPARLTRSPAPSTSPATTRRLTTCPRRWAW